MKTVQFFILFLLFSFQQMNSEYTWTKMNIQEPFYELNQRLNVNYAEAPNGNLYLYVDTVLYHSTNDGANWSEFTHNNAYAIRQVLCDQDGRFFYIANNTGKSQSDSIFYSDDNGISLKSLPVIEPYSTDSVKFYYNLVAKKDTLVLVQDVGFRTDMKRNYQDFLVSTNMGNTWEKIDNLCSNDNNSFIYKLFYIDYNGYIYFIDSHIKNIFYLESIISNPISTNFIATNFDFGFWTNSKILHTNSNNLFIFSDKRLFKYNPNNQIWDTVSLNISKFYDLSYYNGLFYLIGDNKLMTTDEKFEKFNFIRSAKSKYSCKPRVFVTNRGTLIYQDSLGIFWRGVEVNEIEEKHAVSSWLSISPNPANDYIEISYSPSIMMGLGGVSEEVPIRIYDVFGREVNTPQTTSMLGEGENNPLNPPLLRGNLKIDVSSLPPGLYFVRVGGRVGKFLKL